MTIDQGTGHVVGASGLSVRGSGGLGGLLNTIYPTARKIPILSISMHLNLEAALRLRPDAVFVVAGDGEIWKQIGFPRAIELSFDAGSLEASKRKIWHELGRLAGKSYRAQRLLDQAQVNLTQLRLRLAGLGDIDDTRAISLHRSVDGQWILDGRQSNFNLKFDEVRGVSVAGRFSGPLNIEALFGQNPDVILITADGADSSSKTEANVFRQDPVFRSLRAVQIGRVYLTPSFTFLNDPAEDPLLLEWVARVFHPELNVRLLRQHFREVYKNIYDYDISETEIDQTIWPEKNEQSSELNHDSLDVRRTDICKD